MAAATAPADTAKELARARAPLPVKSGADRVSTGLDRAIERSIEVRLFAVIAMCLLRVAGRVWRGLQPKAMQ